MTANKMLPIYDGLQLQLVTVDCVETLVSHCLNYGLVELQTFNDSFIDARLPDINTTM